MNVKLLIVSLAFLASCSLPEEKEIELFAKSEDSILQTIDSNQAIYTRPSLPAITVPAKKQIKSPAGIYQAVLPFNGTMTQTIAFYPNNTYQLQETYYPGKKDSVVITQGTWTPSDGFIWIYKDQLVRGRYSWKEDQLHYFSPVSKKNFAMHALKDVMENAVWKNRKTQGIKLFGIGNEPFWSIEFNTKDSLIFKLADWQKPVQMKISHTSGSADSLSYTAVNDSIRLHVTVLPYFCSDGMSDFVYRNQVRVTYNGTRYKGCGEVY